MASKKITIMFLSEGAKKVRQFKIPKSLIIFSFLFFIAGSLIIAWGIEDYRKIRSKIPGLSKLQKENRHQKEQLKILAHKIENISKKMIELKKFDHKLRVMVNLDPNEETQFYGVGGYNASNMDLEHADQNTQRNHIRLMHQTLDNLDTEISIQTNEKIELYKFLEDQKSMLACTPSIWPTRGWISSGFGYRISPFTNRKEFHQGIDICTRLKTKIIAPADGIVTSVESNYGYGKILTINHGYGLKTRYAHLHKIIVKKGQHIKRGEKIALVGNTGRTTGPHLHYEVHLKGVPMNPLRYILN